MARRRAQSKVWKWGQEVSDAFTYNRAILADIEHLAAHIESGDDFTDYCDRVCIADESRGFVGQILHVWDFALSDTDKENVAKYLDISTADLQAAIFQLRNGQVDRVLPYWDFAGAVDAMTHLYWDGDVFERPEECPLWAEFDRGEWALSVEIQGEHVEVCLACGGPGTYLRRDFDGDRLVTYWGSDRAEARDDALGTVLDYLAEMAG